MGLKGVNKKMHGMKWSDDETIKLLKSIQKKKSIYDIAIEHQRTINAIEHQRRRLATQYWFNDQRPIEQIIKFTGLSKEQIESAIKNSINRKNTIKQSKKEKTLEEIAVLMRYITDTLKELMENDE